jgi:hypothetical protein
MGTNPFLSKRLIVNGNGYERVIRRAGIPFKHRSTQPTARINETEADDLPFDWLPGKSFTAAHNSAGRRPARSQVPKTTATGKNTSGSISASDLLVLNESKSPEVRGNEVKYAKGGHLNDIVSN